VEVEDPTLSFESRVGECLLMEAVDLGLSVMSRRESAQRPDRSTGFRSLISATMAYVLGDDLPGELHPEHGCDGIVDGVGLRLAHRPPAEVASTPVLLPDCDTCRKPYEAKERRGMAACQSLGPTSRSRSAAQLPLSLARAESTRTIDALWTRVNELVVEDRFEVWIRVASACKN
jgi:hypothetical protein